MQSLLLFLGRFRAFFAFVILEVVCWWLVTRNNRYHSAVAFTSANYATGKIYAGRSYLREYFDLREQNARLAQENQRLHQQIARLGGVNCVKPDSGFRAGYEFVVAKVINQSVYNANNYLTIDKGLAHGLAPGMGVVNAEGIVGKIKACSQDFCVAYSVLSKELIVAARLKNRNVMGSLKWPQTNHLSSRLEYVPRHVQVAKGDTVLATGDNAIFPENYLIGYVEEASLQGSSSFLDIKVKLATQFANLNYVYIIKNPRRLAMDTLQTSQAPGITQQ
ncbi:MAG: rod shape-determining protein MreC [Bernardetiaceae bacterium]|jgi:rod shape-determining protein MreC|nr:rod shape-determining protein MreC [Bernardetiaceae bacterium]